MDNSRGMLNCIPLNTQISREKDIKKSRSKNGLSVNGYYKDILRKLTRYCVYADQMCIGNISSSCV